MTHLLKLRRHPILIWVSSSSSQNALISVDTVYCYNVQNPRFYGRRALRVEETENNEERGENGRKFTRAIRVEAQSALLEYLHSTRSLQFMDAEHVSKNSPRFLQMLLENVGDEHNVARAVTRFLRYHPINEFEPFFESIGLEPSEFIPRLPRDFMYLSDHGCFLDNYHVLCNYGIARSKIGKIYEEAQEVFSYENGVLEGKLQAYEKLGLSHSTLTKVVVASPYLLIGDVNNEFVEALRKLKSLGFGYNWVEGRLLDKCSYNWRQILKLLNLFSGLDFDKDQLGSLVRQHPELVFDESGGRTLSLVGFLLKFGSTKNDIRSMFLQFPKVQVEKFVRNLKHGLQFLLDVDMNAEDIGSIIRRHPIVLGSCSLKKPNSVLAMLNTGKRRLCHILKENPHELTKWVMGAKIEKLPGTGEEERSRMEKAKFLLSLGFNENSKEMDKALKVFRGKGQELQERFDCLIESGLSPNDVVRMLKVSPQILNQTKEVIQGKIECLLNDLAYPISSLVSFPSYVSYTTERVKLRCSMYKWLVDRGSVKPNLSLGTIVACTDKYFTRTYVSRHPKGLATWGRLKTTIDSV